MGINTHEKSEEVNAFEKLLKRKEINPYEEKKDPGELRAELKREYQNRHSDDE